MRDGHSKPRTKSFTRTCHHEDINQPLLFLASRFLEAFYPFFVLISCSVNSHESIHVATYNKITSATQLKSGLRTKRSTFLYAIYTYTAELSIKPSTAHPAAIRDKMRCKPLRKQDSKNMKPLQGFITSGPTLLYSTTQIGCAKEKEPLKKEKGIGKKTPTPPCRPRNYVDLLAPPSLACQPYCRVAG